MTVSSTANRVAYSGNGVTTAFSFPYFFLMVADLVVFRTDADGTITPLVLITDYTVTGTQAANLTYPNGGTVTTIATLITGQTITIVRVPDNKQSTHWVDADPDPAAVKELAFDKLTLEVQRLQDLNSRAIAFADGAVLGSFDPTLPALLPGGQLSVLLDLSGFAFLAPGSSTLQPFIPPADGIVTEIDVQGALDEIIPYTFGTPASPIQIVATSGILLTSDLAEQTLFIKGSGGAVNITASPQITAGTRVGQKLRLIAKDNTNTVQLDDGTGLDMAGPWVGVNNSVIEFFWDGSVWVETSRTDRV